MKSQGMRQALMWPTKPDESVRQQGNGLKVCEEQPGDKVSAWDLPSQGVAECLRAGRMCKTSGSTDPTDLVPLGEEEDDESARLKKYFSWWEAGQNECERRNFSAGPEEKCVQHRTGQCAGVKEDPESSMTELFGGEGTGVLSPASEQDACLLHEDDSDQSMCSCQSRASDPGGKDLENLAAPSLLEVWFDTEASEGHESDNLDATATTVQYLRTAFRSSVHFEPPEEVPDNSESITSVGTRKAGKNEKTRRKTGEKEKKKWEEGDEEKAKKKRQEKKKGEEKMEQKRRNGKKKKKKGEKKGKKKKRERRKKEEKLMRLSFS